MSGNIDALTEKEKEALRLLLAGHDAKSSARELDISVHTVSDRLRQARRKMGVSSSREAARILGDAEGTIPQILAPTSFGVVAQEPSAEDMRLTSTSRAGLSRTAWLAGGMLIMSLFIAAAAVAFLVQSGESPDVSLAPAESENSGVAEATDAKSLPRARAFLAEIDAGDWEGSWEIAGPVFQNQLNASQWADAIAPVRPQLGSVLSREVATVQRTSTLPGAPEGEYEVLQFSTQFADHPVASVETVVMLQGTDGWEVTGYFIR